MTVATADRMSCELLMYSDVVSLLLTYMSMYHFVQVAPEAHSAINQVKTKHDNSLRQHTMQPKRHICSWRKIGPGRCPLCEGIMHAHVPDIQVFIHDHGDVSKKKLVKFYKHESSTPCTTETQLVTRPY
jgi:hypothetical protein